MVVFGIPPTKDLLMRKLSSFSPCMMDFAAFGPAHNLALLDFRHYFHLQWHSFNDRPEAFRLRGSDTAKRSSTAKMRACQYTISDRQQRPDDVGIATAWSSQTPRAYRDVPELCVSVTTRSKRRVDQWITLQGQHRMGVSLRGCTVQLYRFPASKSSAGT